jgi:3-oxoacyl-[acyl-carrier protein] reductase
MSRTLAAMIALDLTGKTAIITGGSQGIGAAIATLLHRAGATVAIAYWPDPGGQNQSNADRLAGQLGGRAMAVAGDVRDELAMTAMATQVAARCERIDILINNAGIVRDRSFRKMSLQEWQQVIDTNLTGAFCACKAVEPLMQPGGRIVNLASISAALGFFGQANYAASKSGVIGLTRVLARELAKRQITVNAIAPGVVITDMALTIPPAERERMMTQVPLGRFGDAQDIASCALFLCSDLASYITGQTIHVNGGWHPA